MSATYGWAEDEVLVPCACLDLGWEWCPVCGQQGVVPERLAAIAWSVCRRWLVDELPTSVPLR